MTHPILADFSDRPAYLARECSAWVASCLNGLSRQMAQIEAISASSPDFWADEYAWARPYVVQNGILQVPVRGSLLNGFPYALGGWATGYEYIWAAVSRGLDDSAVQGIALVINSPGGMVAGCFDLVDKIYAEKGRKPMRAYAAESAYSAAYAIASAADTITVSRTGGVGSIGVVATHFDYSQALAHEGVKVTLIYAGKQKVDGNPYEPLPEEVRARFQERVDARYQDFVSLVARNRGMDEADVRETEAATFMASEAVENGLADSIGSLDAALAAFAADLNQSGEDEMTNPTPAAAAAFDANAPEALALRSTATAEGAAAERARITAILTSAEGKDRPIAASAAALETDMTVAQATAFLAKIPVEKTEAAVEPTPAGAGAAAGALAAAMAASPNPEIAGGEGVDDKSGADDKVEQTFALLGKKKAAGK